VDRRNVEEPQIWIDSVKADRGRISLLFTPRSRRSPSSSR
jgi:hypothetical protein